MAEQILNMNLTDEDKDVALNIVNFNKKMSNNIVRDVSDYLKELDSKINYNSRIKKGEKELNELYSEYEEVLKNSAKNFDNTALSDETTKSIMEYNKGLLENKESNIEKNIKMLDLISTKISAKKEEIEELKKEQKAVLPEISKEYNALFERYSESLERIKKLRLKISPTSNINEYGEVIVGGKFGQLNRFIAEEEKPIFENISFYETEIAFHENIMREVYKKLQKLEEKIENNVNGDVVSPIDTLENQNKNEPNGTVSEYDNDEEQEIVNEEDGTELTKKEKFKKIAKKVLKWSAIVGGAALVAGAIYQFMQGDTTSISQVMHGAADAVNNVAGSVDPSQVGLDSTSVGDISNIFQSNADVMNGVNAMTPNEWARDQIVGIVDANNNVYDASTIGDIVNAQNNGIDVQSVAVGDEFAPGKVSGFVDIDSVSLGGKSR